MSRELFLRIGSSIALIPIVTAVILLDGIYLSILISIALLLMLIEWTKISYKQTVLFYTGCAYIGVSMLFWLINTDCQRLLLLILPLVWSIDIGAYFGGKLIGGAKLAPKISPQKTWSGAIVGFISSFFVYFAYINICHYIPTYTNFLATVFFAILAILGDLLESKTKRLLCIKDSGSLIPGHGGILDRLDSFIAVTWGLIILSIIM